MHASVSAPATDTELTAGNPIGGQFLRFCLVGAANTCTAVLTYAVLLFVGIPYLIAIVIGYTTGTLQGYTLHRRWTFRRGAFNGLGLTRYAVVQLGGLGGNLLLAVLLVEVAGWDKLLAQVIALPAIVVCTFAASRGWAFAVRHHA